MVRIQRNDAPPRQTINLISDEEQEPSNSSSASNNSSNSSSSSDSEEKQVMPSPSSLSDFIEEDDEPRPALKSSSSSWEPIKPQRRRRRTLRKKPRLDKTEADDEHSTSSDSTSSDGIPRPQVEIDADDEEDHVETTPTQRTPKKRKRPRRTAAPPCFLDAVNKFVEPMSKDARKYQNLTLRQILYGDSEDEDHPENSNDSSVEYVPDASEKKKASTRSESEDSDGSEENGFGADKNPRNVGESSSKRRVSSQPRTTDAPSGRTSSPMQSHGGNLSDTEDQNSREHNNRSSASKIRRFGDHRDSPELANTDEKERHSNVLENERGELQELNDSGPTVPRCQKSKLHDLQKVPAGCNCEDEVIDLCSNDESETTRFEDGAQHSRMEGVRTGKEWTSEHTERQITGDIAKTDLPATEPTRIYDVEKGSYPRKYDNSIFEAERPYSSPHYVFARDCANESSMLGAFSDAKTAPEDHTSAGEEGDPATLKRQEDLKHCINNDSKRCDTERKMESRPQVCNEEVELDPIGEPRSKLDMDVTAGEDYKTSGIVPGSGTGQTHLTSTGNLGSNTKLDGSAIVALGQRRRFKGAKRRGNNLHPDVYKKRVPRSQEEREAWLAFAKSEARDIYRTFATDESSRRYICASIEVLFIRQILAELGKLMGLNVRSEKDGAGRRIILEKSPTDRIGGSEEEAQQLIEQFFNDALKDLLDEPKNSKRKGTRVSQRKDVNESPKTSGEGSEKAQGPGEDGSALPRIDKSRAKSSCNRKRGEKRKRSSRVARKESGRNKC